MASSIFYDPAGTVIGGALTLFTSVAAVANVNAGETDLLTYTLAGSTLANAGQTVSIVAAVQGAANGNTKTVKLYFGSTVLASIVSASSGEIFRLTADVTRLTGTTQFSTATRVSGGAAVGQFTSPGETLTGNVVIKVTGTGAASADLTSSWLKVTFAP